MATAKQIKYRIGQTKKKLNKLNKEVTAKKNKLKALEGQLKKAGKAAVKPKAKKKVAKKKAAKKKVSKKKR
ncbi:MAG: hypothetical protein AB1512_16585 [Thermodesulfobacteriota bacterium]